MLKSTGECHISIGSRWTWKKISPEINPLIYSRIYSINSKKKKKKKETQGPIVTKWLYKLYVSRSLNLIL